MAQYPTVYNQNAGDDDKEGGMGLDLGMGDEGAETSLRSQYADGDDEAKSLKELDVPSK